MIKAKVNWVLILLFFINTSCIFRSEPCPQLFIGKFVMKFPDGFPDSLKNEYSNLEKSYLIIKEDGSFIFSCEFLKDTVGHWEAQYISEHGDFADLNFKHYHGARFSYLNFKYKKDSINEDMFAISFPEMLLKDKRLVHDIFKFEKIDSLNKCW